MSRFHSTRRWLSRHWDLKLALFGREPDLMGKESGSHDIQIVHLATMQSEIVPGSEGMFSPRWSPDGRWIATLSLDQKSVWICGVAHRNWRRLAANSAADPVWSFDSKAIYIHAFLEDKQPIWGEVFRRVTFMSSRT